LKLRKDHSSQESIDSDHFDLIIGVREKIQ